MSSLARTIHRLLGVALAVAVIAMIVGCGGSRPSAPVDRSSTAQPSDYQITYPSTWTPPPQLPHSQFLNFLAVGHSSVAGCPSPLLLVRRQVAPAGSLSQAVALYNRVEQLRRPQRRVVAQQSVPISGAREAVLIEARFPATGSPGRIVTSYDLLALSTRGVAFHVFASGCAADLPRSFLKRYILSFDAATGTPGQTGVSR